MAKEVKQNTDPAETAKLEAIKEIIFGNNIREYEKEFAEIREFININFTAVDKEISVFKKHVDDLEKKLFARIEANHKEPCEKIDSLNEKKMDRRKLGKLLSDIGEKISA